jgi:hypothetical protein
MENKMERDGDMEESAPSMGMKDSAPATDDVRDGLSMEPTMHPESDMGSRKWGWLRRLTRRS